MNEHVQLALEVDEEQLPADVYPAGFAEPASAAPRLERITISGLKAFDKTEVLLSSLTLLTGPNNSGKSTVLQAIALGYECLRRCTDTTRWKLVESGRAVTAFEFLPVNEPRDLWHKRIWKPSRSEERTVEISLHLSGSKLLTFKIRFLFGLLNIKLQSFEGNFDGDTLQALLTHSPVLLPATPGPAPHEDYLTLASVHKLLSIREPSRVVRNILLRLQQDGDTEALKYVNDVLDKYFGVSLAQIIFEERRDLEIRAPISQAGYDLDIVSSGSGLNQLLQLACIIAWRKPSIVLLDEPDAHLHSSVQIELFDFLSDLSIKQNIQVILSTHSRDLISQAPLESIVPVDPSRGRLQPLESLDHLLLEYQRYGPLSNVDLALLYQTKRCLFVEGASDVKYLPRIAERCGISVFSGPNQTIPFEFQGVDKLKFLPDLVALFSRLTGGGLKWGVIRDSDCNVPEVKRHYQQCGEDLGADWFYQWQRHSIENYLLEPALLCHAVNVRAKGDPIDKTIVNALLEQAIEDIEDQVAATFVTRAQLAFRELRLADNPHEAGAQAATRFLRTTTTLEAKLLCYPGKRIFSKLVGKLQERYGVNLRIDDIITVLTPEMAPTELLECLNSLACGYSEPTKGIQQQDAADGSIIN